MGPVMAKTLAVLFFACTNLIRLQACDLKILARLDDLVSHADRLGPELLDLLNWPLHQLLAAGVEPYLPRNRLQFYMHNSNNQSPI